MQYNWHSLISGMDPRFCIALTNSLAGRIGIRGAVWALADELRGETHDAA